MSTTTLRLPPEVKARIERLAAAAGKTPHALMLDRLSESLDRMEEQASFDAEVERRWRQFKRTGEYDTLEDVRTYILAKARGEDALRPVPRKTPADELARIRARDRGRGGK